MQNINVDIPEAISLLEGALNYLKQYCSDIKFEETLKEAEVLAETLEIENKNFPEKGIIRQRKKKKLFDYESPDEPILEPKQKFKVQCYFTVLDSAIASIEERFTQLKSHNDNFHFLYNIAKEKSTSQERLLKECMKLESSLTDSKGDCDIDGKELYEELVALREVIHQESSMADVLEHILRNGNYAPNTSVALRILLTLPVTVASGERSFSKLKIIKNYLRSTMAQMRLTGLATVSIESALVKKLNLKHLVSTFAEMKARKISFS